MAPAILSSVIRYIRIHAIRTYAFLPFLSFPSPIRSRASYGGNPVFGRFFTPWIPVPRLRRDKTHGNYTPPPPTGGGGEGGGGRGGGKSGVSPVEESRERVCERALRTEGS